MKTSFICSYVLWLIVGAFAFPASTFSQAAEDSHAKHLDDDYGDAFLNYQPYVIKGKKPENKLKEPQSPPPSASERPKSKEEPVTVNWLRRHYAEIEARAIDNPTRENMEAIGYTKRITLDKASRYQLAYAELLRTDPWLNENNRIPYASTGARSVAAANYNAQQEAVRDMAKVGGLMLFVDGQCRHCAAQIPIINALRHDYGMNVLIVSTDGTKPQNLSGSVLTDNGMFKRLGLSLRPSLVYVPTPKGFTPGTKDPNRYLIVSQGFYALDELIKQIAYAGFYIKMLPAKVMADLDAWNNGIMSTDDMRDLRLDVNDPSSFKSKVAPLVMRQYEQNRNQ